ncbi:MAG: hypothetical protein IKH54_01680 [Bacilli bacterium]|nr:hypothetical protein [Bacilli bacterium]
MRKIKLLLIYFILLFPISVFAYDKVIPGGETIGIEVHSNGVLVVGFYKVNGKSIAKDNGFKLGDTIIKVNNIKVYNIDSMLEVIEKSNDKATFTVVRNNKIKTITSDLILEDDTLKTGLYVKDQINGLGTLSFILEDKTFGSLGHEIMESSTLERFDISNGEIYDASVSEIIKSYDGSAGEKNAIIDKSEITGIVTENDTTGIYGNYNGDISNREFVDVGSINDISLGEAYIRTVVEGDRVEQFKINILNINKNDRTKNILFEIVDSNLINKTGGVIQGMSGSPIMQNGKMIGVVNYVIVNEPTKGYGIFLTTMLDEIN